MEDPKKVLKALEVLKAAGYDVSGFKDQYDENVKKYHDHLLKYKSSDRYANPVAKAEDDALWDDFYKLSGKFSKRYPLKVGETMYGEIGDKSVRKALVKSVTPEKVTISYKGREFEFPNSPREDGRHTGNFVGEIDGVKYNLRRNILLDLNDMRYYDASETAYSDKPANSIRKFVKNYSNESAEDHRYDNVAMIIEKMNG